MEKNGTVISHETNAYLESLDGMNLAELKDAEARAKIALLVIAKLVVISELVYPSRQLEGLFLATINKVKAPEKKRKKSYQTDSQSFDFDDDGSVEVEEEFIGKVADEILKKSKPN
jgi:hypothetical protein